MTESSDQTDPFWSRFVQSLFPKFMASFSPNFLSSKLPVKSGCFRTENLNLLEPQIISGSAKLGFENYPVQCGKLIVVNGALNARDVVFKTLEVNGSCNLNKCKIEGTIAAFGTFESTDTVFETGLSFKGSKLVLNSCTINGTLSVSNPFRNRIKIVLKNCNHKGEISSEEGLKVEVIRA